MPKFLSIHFYDFKAVKRNLMKVILSLILKFDLIQQSNSCSKLFFADKFTFTT